MCSRLIFVIRNFGSLIFLLAFVFLQVVFYGEEGVDAGGVRKVKCPARKIAMFALYQI